MRRNTGPAWITARFDSLCAETGAKLQKGDRILFWNGKAYSENSKHADEARALEFNAAYCMPDANW